jgi:hypothetical protein
MSTQTKRTSQAASHFGHCPSCRQPAAIACYWKNNIAVCPDCKLYLGIVAYNVVSAEFQIFDSVEDMRARCGGLRHFSHIEPWMPEPAVTDWSDYYELVAEELRTFEPAELTHDIGPPYVGDDDGPVAVDA